MKWLSTVNRGPWTKFCQRLTDHSQQQIVIVETKRTISANTVDRGPFLSTVDSQQPIVIVETKCTITAIDGGQWTVVR